MVNSNTQINEELLKDLSEQERDQVLKILKEVADTGNSPSLNDLLLEDYIETPVDIETFLTDDKYLGKAWKDAGGNSKLYPYWFDILKKLFPNNFDTNYDTVLESGARGIGKSEVACGAMCTYLMYRIMCLKNPLEFYHLKQTDKICFAFMNITLDSSKKIAIDKFQNAIQMSPWFMARGTMTQFENSPYWIPPKPLEIIIGSQSSDVRGKPVFFAFMDEVSFRRNKDINEQKAQAMDIIDTAIGGMKTRFIYKGKNPTLLVVASSKRSEQSFMESYIKLLNETSKDNTLVIDEPVWNIKPAGTYSKEIFYVGLGNKYLENKVIKDGEDLDVYRKRGYKILEVPVDFKENALKDLNRMLCDYAGVSNFSSNKFISGEQLSSIVSDDIQNPMPDVITVGNAVDDKAEYKDFFDFSKLNRQLLEKPLFIHLDLSLTGDKTGIAGTWIIGKKPAAGGDSSKDLFYQPAFSFSVQAPYGQQISFAKTRNFIRWLKEKDFKIKKITSDTFQSAPVLQELTSNGFDCAILSVDRTETVPGEKVGICKPYEYLKNTIYEKRLKLYQNKLLYNELVQLEKDNNTGKVDHPAKGSKDQADALCGSVYTASQYADQYSYDFGDDIDIILKVNKEKSNDVDQFMQDFNEQVKQAAMQQINIDTPINHPKMNISKSSWTDKLSEDEKKSYYDSKDILIF